MRTNRRTKNNKYISNYKRLTPLALVHFFRIFRREIIFSLTLILSPSLASAYQISSGDNHTCAIDDTGVKCWGYNKFDQTTVPALSNPTQVKAGGNHTCALDDNGAVCWGWNRHGQTAPTESLASSIQVAAGYSHSCSLNKTGDTEDTKVLCWGQNNARQSTVPALSNPTQVTAGHSHTCALDDSGVVCWGSNAFGQSTTPELLENPIQITSGYHHTCTLFKAGDTGGTKVLCWGRNNFGQSAVPPLSNPTQVTAGSNHTCALDDSGVVCWGWNGSGQRVVPALSNPTQVSAGFGHTCALDDSGVVCWGWNANGQSTVDSSLSFTAINGNCGESHEKVFTSIPTESLCATGVSSAITGTDPWTWSCSGAYGGNDASCSTKTEQEPAVNGICGESHEKVFTSIPTENLCATGASSAISGTDPWTWSCAGANGGSDASCSTKTAATPVPAVNGSCGASHQQIFSSIPTENLCATGASSSVTGTNPWAWSCTGTNGGSNASCSTIRTGQEENQINFIERFYQNILNRTADSDGMNFWLNTIQNESGAAVAFGFFNSQEFNDLHLDNTAFINILYQTLFGRQPDQGGFDFWMAQLTAGTLKETIIQGFVRSQEFSDLASSFGVVALNDKDNTLFQIESFIERFYELVLNRKPDLEGFNYWSDQLTDPNGSKSAGDIARGFFQSNEFIDRQTGDSEFIDIAYHAFFDREADKNGKQYWLSELSAGTPRLDVVNGFIVSQEFIDFANRYGIRAD